MLCERAESFTDMVNSIRPSLTREERSGKAALLNARAKNATSSTLDTKKYYQTKTLVGVY